VRFRAPLDVLALLGRTGRVSFSLIKILGGSSAGRERIKIDGAPIVHSPADARRASITVIYQKIQSRSWAHWRNLLFLGRETTRFGFDHQAEKGKGGRWLNRIG
jgi:ABC-type sugar transport system ATPase subunit